jgi:hypothetical protein
MPSSWRSFPQVGFELSEHAEHIEERFAGRGAGVDRLFGGLERGALGLHRANDVLQVADASRQSVDSGVDREDAAA